MKIMKATLPGSFKPERLPGFYIEGRYYGTKFNQAAGRATFLAAEHKRNIDVQFVDHLGVEERKLTVVAKSPQYAAHPASKPASKASESRHVCGLQGFNQMIDGSCPGCSMDRQKWG